MKEIYLHTRDLSVGYNGRPLIQQAGIMTIGFAVRKSPLIRWGAAMPTKEMGPAKAVTQAERTWPGG